MCTLQQPSSSSSDVPADDVHTTSAQTTLDTASSEGEARHQHQQQVMKRKVSFAETVDVEVVMSLTEMTPEEKKATWYDPLDQLVILSEVRDAVDDIVESLKPVQCWWPWARRSTPDAGVETVCTRGLEHEVDDLAREIRSVCRRRFFSVVIGATKRQPDKSGFSAEISKISERHSRRARDYARRMGEVDAACAADIYCDDALHGMPLFEYETAE